LGKSLFFSLFLYLAVLLILGALFGDLLGFGNSFLLVLGSDEIRNSLPAVSGARGELNGGFS
jgi:hypothetical protein